MKNLRTEFFNKNWICLLMKRWSDIGPRNDSIISRLAKKMGKCRRLPHPLPFCMPALGKTGEGFDCDISMWRLLQTNKYHMGAHFLQFLWLIDEEKRQNNLWGYLGDISKNVSEAVHYYKVLLFCVWAELSCDLLKQPLEFGFKNNGLRWDGRESWHSLHERMVFLILISMLGQ